MSFKSCLFQGDGPFKSKSACSKMVRVRTTCESVSRKTVLQAILTKLGQWDDIIISQLQAIFQLFSSYPPPRESFAKLANDIQNSRNWRMPSGKCLFVQKSGPNLSLGFSRGSRVEGKMSRVRK